MEKDIVIEEKAAMLLYLVTKNHSFTDGNKRIAATLFLWFMEKNGILYSTDGGKRIADNALVALTQNLGGPKLPMGTFSVASIYLENSPYICPAHTGELGRKQVAPSA